MRIKRAAVPPRPARPGRLAGMFTVEFALVVGMFLLLVFGLIEFARAMYLWNAAKEITSRAARAAAVTDFSDQNAMAQVRQNAVFRSSAGALALGGAITDQYVRIEYLSLVSNGSGADSMPVLDVVNTGPTNPTANVVNCLNNPRDSPNAAGACIRMVRASLCAPGGGACAPVPYVPLMPLLAPFFAGVHLPTAATAVPAETLGYYPGRPNSP